MYHRLGARRTILIAVAAAIGLLVLVAIGLVIETALGPKTKQHLSPPTPVTVPGAAGGSRGVSQSPGPTLTGPLQLIQGRELVNGVYLGYPHSTQGAVSAADEF